MKKVIFILLLMCLKVTYSQNLSIFDVDNSKYPTFKAKCFAFDKNGNQLFNLSTYDFLLLENGKSGLISKISCPAPKLSPAISSVLIIDASGSMSNENIIYAKAAAKSWINGLPLGKSECAITSFDDKNYVVRDFTTDRNSLINSVDKIEPNGFTDYNAAFLNSMAGGLLMTKKAKFKKVIVIITDGVPNYEPKTQEIINEANNQNVTIYTVTLGMKCPNNLKEISVKTGGNWYENISSLEQAQSTYRKILSVSQDIDPCDIEWTCTNICGTSNLNLEINCLPINKSEIFNFSIPKDKIPKLTINPEDIFMGGVTPGNTKTEKVKITAINSDFQINNISNSHIAFDITPKNFYLKKGESKDLIITFKPLDSVFCMNTFSIETSICDVEINTTGGFAGFYTKAIPLKVVHPNGGEVFNSGKDTTITWKGISSQYEVIIEYSYDNGKSWNLLTDKGKGLSYLWKNIPLPVSNKCLVKVSTKANEGGTPQIIWQKTLGGSASDEVTSSTQTSDWGYILAGITGSFDKEIVGNHGYLDAWVVKLNSLGETEWKKCYGGTAEDWPTSIIQLESGGYILLGNSESNNGNVSGNHGGFDNWLVKLDEFGSIVWQKCFGGKNDDIATSIQQTFDGGFIIAGNSESNDGNVSGNHGNKDYWVLKINSNGDVEWQKCLGGSGNDFATCIFQTNDDGFIVGGYTESNNGDVIGNHGGSDYWVVKLNSNGSIIWSKVYGGSRIEKLASIKKTQNGEILVAGSTNSIDGDVKGTKGLNDYWVLKLDNEGTILWQKCLGGSKNDYCFDLKATTDNGCIVAGEIESSDGDILGYNSSFNSWIVKLKENGSILWQVGLNSFVKNIHQTYDDGFAFSGFKENGGFGLSDFWFAKYGSDGFTPSLSDSSNAVFAIVKPELKSQDINMGDVVVNKMKDSLLSNFINNVGLWDCSVDSIYFKGKDPNSFKLLGPIPKFIVGKESQYQNGEFVFTPNAIRDFEADMIIITQNDTLKHKIFGKGVEEKISALNKFIDFGTHEISNQKDTTISLIQNVSSKDVQITKVEMIGPDKDQFEFVNPIETQPFILQPGKKYDITLRYNPKWIGRTSGQVGFYFDSPDSPIRSQLFGAGIGAVVTASYDSSYAGEDVNVKINMQSSKDLKKFSELISSFDGIIKVENSILYPIVSKDIVKRTNDSIFVKFKGNVNPDSSLLTIVPFKAGLGRVEETTIDFENINWYDINGNKLPFGTDVFSGAFKLLGVCGEGGNRLINPQRMVSIQSIYPNPADEKFNIELLLIESGFTELSLINTFGENVIKILSEKINEFNKRDFEVDIRNLPSGQYILKLRTPTYTETKQIIILK